MYVYIFRHMYIRKYSHIQYDNLVWFRKSFAVCFSSMIREPPWSRAIFMTEVVRTQRGRPFLNYRNLGKTISNAVNKHSQNIKFSEKLINFIRAFSTLICFT